MPSDGNGVAGALSLSPEQRRADYPARVEKAERDWREDLPAQLDYLKRAVERLVARKPAHRPSDARWPEWSAAWLAHGRFRTPTDKSKKARRVLETANA